MGGSMRSHTRFYRQQKRAPMSDINVTPLVDVMLVLLIIFMVTAPMITAGIPVDLPQTKASGLNEKGEPVSLTMTANGDLYLQDARIDLEVLIQKLKQVMTANPDTQIFIRGDKDIPYGTIIDLMGTLNTNGFNKIALITDLPKPSVKTKG